MAIGPMMPPRRILLLLAFLLAASSALAGGLATALVLRGHTSPPPRLDPVPVAAPMVPAADPQAALDAALGQLPGMLLPAAPAAAPMGWAAAALPGFVAPGLSGPSISAPSLTAPRLAAPPIPQPAAAPAPPPAPAAMPPLPSGYSLDLGYFLVPDQAQAFAARLRERGLPVQALTLPDASGRVWTHIRTAPFAGSAQALVGAERIEREFGLVANLVPPEAPPPQAGAKP